MSSEDNNLLISLSKWAKRSGENFTTEAFVHLFRHLREYEPRMACDLLSEMTYGQLKLTEGDVERLTFNTQVTYSEGRPDIEITAPDCVIFIEVKVSADLEKNQLKRYQRALTASNVSNKMLILLSRLPSTSPDSREADISIRWYQIAGWLDIQLNKGTAIHETSKYVIQQFVDFLQGNNLVIKPVRRRIINEFQKMHSLRTSQRQGELSKLEELLDYPTLYNLLMMMDQVIDIQVRPILVEGKQGDEARWIGYNIQNGKYFFYVQFYGKECKLVFTTWNCRIDPHRTTEKPGQVVQYAGPLRWENELILGGASVQFFSSSKTKEDQIKIIDKFYKNSYEFVQNIVIQA